MIEALNELMESMASDDDLFRNMAKMTKRYYDELIIVGFTPEQAVAIVINFKMAG